MFGAACFSLVVLELTKIMVNGYTVQSLQYMPTQFLIGLTLLPNDLSILIFYHLHTVASTRVSRHAIDLFHRFHCFLGRCEIDETVIFLAPFAVLVWVRGRTRTVKGSIDISMRSLMSCQHQCTVSYCLLRK